MKFYCKSILAIILLVTLSPVKGVPYRASNREENTFYDHAGQDRYTIPANVFTIGAFHDFIQGLWKTAMKEIYHGDFAATFRQDLKAIVDPRWDAPEEIKDFIGHLENTPVRNNRMHHAEAAVTETSYRKSETDPILNDSAHQNHGVLHKLSNGLGASAMTQILNEPLRDHAPEVIKDSIGYLENKPVQNNRMRADSSPQFSLSFHALAQLANLSHLKVDWWDFLNSVANDPASYCKDLYERLDDYMQKKIHEFLSSQIELIDEEIRISNQLQTYTSHALDSIRYDQLPAATVHGNVADGLPTAVKLLLGDEDDILLGDDLSLGTFDGMVDGDARMVDGDDLSLGTVDGISLGAKLSLEAVDDMVDGDDLALGALDGISLGHGPFGEGGSHDTVYTFMQPAGGGRELCLETDLEYFEECSQFQEIDCL